MEEAAGGRVLLALPGVSLALALPPRLLRGELSLRHGPQGLVLHWEPLEENWEPPGEEDPPDPGFEPDWAVLSPPRPHPQPGWAGGFSLPLGQLRGLRRGPPGLSPPLLVLLPRGGGPCPPPLLLPRGGLRELRRALGGRLRPSPRDPRLLLLTTPEDPPEPPPGPGLVTRLLRGPCAATLGGLGLGGLGRLLGGPRGGEGPQPEPEPPFELLTCVTLAPRPSPARGPPLAREDWGRGLSPEELRERIFRGGLSPELRPQAWPLLLGLQGWGDPRGSPKNTRGSPKNTRGSPKTDPGTPKNTRGSPKTDPGTPKTDPGTPKTDRRTPKNTRGTPKTDPGTPKTDPGTPKNTQGTPKTSEGTPKTSEGTPKIREGTPKIPLGTPTTNPGTPKTDPGTPKTDPGTPKTDRRTPKNTRGTPKTDPGTPKTDPGTPKNTQGTPKTSEGTPKTDLGTPKNTQGTPKTSEGTPKTDPGTPKTSEGTPKIHEGTPKISEGTPKIHEGTPKIHEGTPKISEGTPKIHEETPESLGGTPKIHEETPDPARARRDEYFRMKLQWRSLSPGQLQRNKTLRGYLERMERDVARAPPWVSPGLLRDVLRTFCMFHFDLGYVGGMVEVLAPLAGLWPDEAELFWAFCSVMEMVGENFGPGREGLRRKLGELGALVRVLNPGLSPLLGQARSLRCCSRWLQLRFQRQLGLEGTRQLWEVLWTGLPCPNFLLLVTCALLELLGDSLGDTGDTSGDTGDSPGDIPGDSDSDGDTAQGDTDSEDSDGDKVSPGVALQVSQVLSRAEGIFLQLAATEALPPALQELLGLGGRETPRNWDGLGRTGTNWDRLG